MHNRGPQKGQQSKGWWHKGLVWLFASCIKQALCSSCLMCLQSLGGPCSASQRSLHNEPIFRLLLKVAVKGTQQCDFLNFCGVSPQLLEWLFSALPSVYTCTCCAESSAKPFPRCFAHCYRKAAAQHAIASKKVKCKQSNWKGKNFNKKVACSISLCKSCCALQICMHKICCK